MGSGGARHGGSGRGGVDPACEEAWQRHVARQRWARRHPCLHRFTPAFLCRKRVLCCCTIVVLVAAIAAADVAIYLVGTGMYVDSDAACPKLPQTVGSFSARPDADARWHDALAFQAPLAGRIANACPAPLFGDADVVVTKGDALVARTDTPLLGTANGEVHLRDCHGTRSFVLRVAPAGGTFTAAVGGVQRSVSLVVQDGAGSKSLAYVAGDGMWESVVSVRDATSNTPVASVSLDAASGKWTFMVLISTAAGADARVLSTLAGIRQFGAGGGDACNSFFSITAQGLVLLAALLLLLVLCRCACVRCRCCGKRRQDPSLLEGDALERYKAEQELQRLRRMERDRVKFFAAWDARWQREQQHKAKAEAKALRKQQHGGGRSDGVGVQMSEAARV